MNDFTKDELELIKAYMFGGSYSISAKDLGVLEEKLQSLIDNHCEHTPGNFYTSNAPHLYQCEKCQGFYR